MAKSAQQLADWLEEYFGPNPSDAACEPKERQKEQWRFLGERLHEFIHDEGRSREADQALVDHGEYAGRADDKP